MKMFCVRDSDPLGTRLAERGLVARAARACRKCAQVALQYNTIVWGTPIRPTYEVADFCALVKESEQAECRDKMLALRYFGMTEAQPRTPSASTLNSRGRTASVVTGSAVPSRWTSTYRSASVPSMSARTTRSTFR